MKNKINTKNKKNPLVSREAQTQKNNIQRIFINIK